MPFDRAAHRTQAARIVEHTAGGEVLLRFLGKGSPFPAAVRAERPTANDAKRDLGVQRLEVVTIARAVRDATCALVFTGKLPREGDHFTTASRILRIQEDRSETHGPVLVYLCASAPLES